MLVDPRPYTYQYRKPRYSNPTFQSRNLFQSLYHRYPYESGNDYFTSQERNMYYSAHKLQKPKQPQQEYNRYERNRSEVKDRRYDNEHMKMSEPVQNNPERQIQGYKLPSIKLSQGSNTQRARADNNVGSHIDREERTEQIIAKKQGFQRFRVYERQQKPFNIISCYPKGNQNNKLRSFPKLTLEDKLFERGSYHNFKEERF